MTSIPQPPYVDEDEAYDKARQAEADRKHAYLGDGVYASFDGYHIWLTVGDHRNPGLVALEPQVLEALNLYAKRVLTP